MNIADLNKSFKHKLLTGKNVPSSRWGPILTRKPKTRMLRPTKKK